MILARGAVAVVFAILYIRGPLYSTNHANLIPLRPDQAHLAGHRGMEFQGLSIEEEAEQTQELSPEGRALSDEALE